MNPPGSRDKEKIAISAAMEMLGINVGFYGPCPCEHHKQGSDLECHCCGYDVAVRDGREECAHDWQPYVLGTDVQCTKCKMLKASVYDR